MYVNNVSKTYNPKDVVWKNYKDIKNKDFRINFDYSLLGYDLKSKRLDMLLRYPKNFSFCRRHRHVASTVTLVLQGEQNIIELAKDGSKKVIHRKKGDYAISGADALPHLENGGATGGTVLLSMTTSDDEILFEYFDENMKNSWFVTLQQYVNSWNNNLNYGVKA